MRYERSSAGGFYTTEATAQKAHSILNKKPVMQHAGLALWTG